LAINSSRSVLIALPTFQREEYLQNCLHAVRQLTIPQGFEVQLVLLDNNDDDLASHVFDTFQFPFAAYRLHVLEKGIVPVRNRGIEEAIKANVRYLAFLDDDTIPTKNWLSEGIQVLENTEADFVDGPVQFVFPAGFEWLSQVRPFLRNDRKEGPISRAVSTRSVIFSMDFVRQHALRFSSQFNLTGGSDLLFFHQAEQKGARARWCKGASVEEMVPESRLTFRWLMRRRKRLGIGESRVVAITRGKSVAWTKALSRFFTLVSRGWRLFFHTLFTRPVDLVGRNRKVFWYNYFGYMAHARGLILGLIGFRVKEYKKIHGR